MQIVAVDVFPVSSFCYVRIRTDAGIHGIGEASLSGRNMAVVHAFDHLRPLLLGQDATRIEHIWQDIFRGTFWRGGPVLQSALAGIDIALWDLAGKILGQPVCTLLGGPFRDAIPMYSHGIGLNMLDKASCRDWAQRIKQQPEGFTAFKNGIDGVAGVRSARFADHLTSEQLRRIARAYSNVREAVGDEIDIAVHCHNEFDTPSAIAVAKAVEPMNPLFYEDALNVPFSEGWMALKRSTRIPILTGEKLELVRGFRPFLDNQAVDIIHPDLAFAGGLTGTRKIADYAALSRIPVALHNVGSLVLCYANAHFGASIQNFYRSESALGRPNRYVESMARSNPPLVRESKLKVPEGPGLGLDLDFDFLKKNLAPGEEFWG
jgi:galactonate dehydratase